MNDRFACCRAFAIVVASYILIGTRPDASRADDAKAPASGGPLVAYAWSGEPNRYSHIVPMYWIVSPRDLNDPSLAKVATDAMPDGHRVLFLWDFARAIDKHPEDCCRDVAGNLTKIRGIWWDRGVTEVAERIDRWFAEYKRLGGRLDTVVLDYEAGFTNWALGNTAARYQAIQSDPRFEVVAKELGLHDLDAVRNWRSGDAHRQWNALMQRRQSDYINRAVFEPIRRHFPQVWLSNYGYEYNAPPHVCPDRNGYEHSRFGVGAHVGTHQSPPIYGWLGSVRWSRAGRSGLERGGDGPEYGATPFAAFRLAVNQTRSAKLSSAVPLLPWVSHKRFRESLLRDCDLYQELIFHIGLTGPDALLFWNPQHRLKTQDPDHFTTPEQEQLLSDCLVELNHLLGEGPRQTLGNQLAGWTDDFVLSGMRCGDRSLWRFTPLLSDGQAIDKTIAQPSPAILRTAKTRIAIPGGRVHRPEASASQLGLWIIAPANSGPRIAMSGQGN